jgi:hypothetical protein
LSSSTFRAYLVDDWQINPLVPFSSDDQTSR